MKNFFQKDRKTIDITPPHVVLCNCGMRLNSQKIRRLAAAKEEAKAMGYVTKKGRQHEDGDTTKNKEGLSMKKPVNRKFELWTNGENTVLIYTYIQDGEGFSRWTADRDILPESAQEGQEWLQELDWEVENMAYLRNNSYLPKEDYTLCLEYATEWTQGLNGNSTIELGHAEDGSYYANIHSTDGEFIGQLGFELDGSTTWTKWETGSGWGCTQPIDRWK